MSSVQCVVYRYAHEPNLLGKHAYIIYQVESA